MTADVVAESILSISGFWGTNLENVAILVSVYCADSKNASAVRFGFLLGSFLLLFLSLAALSLAGWMPIRFLGLLGLIPIALGIKELIQPALLKKKVKKEIGSETDTSSMMILSAALLMAANGGDTIAVFAPLFAETERSGVVVLTIGFLVAAIVLAILSGRVCVHPSLSGALQHHGPKVAPFIMIGIGIYILLNTGTDLLPDRKANAYLK